MSLSMIGAMGINREIGKDNKLLWHISKDLKNFKRITSGKTIIMGRKTFESLGKPLPNRDHVVLTRDASYNAIGARVFHSVEGILNNLEENNIDDAVVIGGGMIYELFLPLVNTLYLSKVQWSGEADTFFPDISLEDFSVKNQEDFAAVDKSPAWSFLELGRK